MKITLHELKNQAVHFLIGGLVSWITIGITFIFFGFDYSWKNTFTAIYVVAVLALTVEICQYLYADNHELKLSDRILDFSTYVISSLSTLVLFFTSL